MYIVLITGGYFMKKQLLRIFGFMLSAMLLHVSSYAAYSSGMNFEQRIPDIIERIELTMHFTRTALANANNFDDKRIALDNFREGNLPKSTLYSNSAAHNENTALLCRNAMQQVYDFVLEIINNQLTPSLNAIIRIEDLPIPNDVINSFNLFQNKIINIANAFVLMENNSISQKYLNDVVKYKNQQRNGKIQQFTHTQELCNLINQTITLIKEHKTLLVNGIATKRQDLENRQLQPALLRQVQDLQNQVRQQAQGVVLNQAQQQALTAALAPIPQTTLFQALRQLQQELVNIQQFLNQQQQDLQPYNQLFNNHWINLHVAPQNAPQNIKTQIEGNNGQIEQNGQIIKQNMALFFSRIMARQNPEQWLTDLNQYLTTTREKLPEGSNVETNIIKPLKLQAELPIPQGGNIRGIIARPATYFDWFITEHIPTNLDAKQNFNEQIAFIIELIAISDANTAIAMRNVLCTDNMKSYFNRLQETARSLKQNVDSIITEDFPDRTLETTLKWTQRQYDDVMALIASFNTVYQPVIKSIIKVPFFTLLATYVDTFKVMALEDDVIAQHLAQVGIKLRTIATNSPELVDDVSVLFSAILSAWHTDDRLKNALTIKDGLIMSKKKHITELRGKCLIALLLIAEEITETDITELRNLFNDKRFTKISA